MKKNLKRVWAACCAIACLALNSQMITMAEDLEQTTIEDSRTTNGEELEEVNVSQYQKGDIDMNGELSALDCRAILIAYCTYNSSPTGDSGLTKEQEYLADFDNDGKIMVFDYKEAIEEYAKQQSLKRSSVATSTTELDVATPTIRVD